MFSNITHISRCHPFTILDDDLFNNTEVNEEVVHISGDDISPTNDLEDSNATVCTFSEFYLVFKLYRYGL